MIHLSRLKKRVGPRTLIRPLDLTVERGEVVVVIGPSGSGKSTLLRLIGGLEPFDSGTLRVGPLKITPDISHGSSAAHRETLRQLRLRMGMVFQQFNLFPHLTVLDNLIEAPLRVLGLSRDQALGRARKLLDKVHLSGLSGRYPRQLSGGEQQRVAIARTLAMNPDCVLFDEPTSALDPERVGEVLEVMRELAQEGMTMIVVSHEMSFARAVAHRVAMLDDGRIVEMGPPAELLGNPREERTRRFLNRIVDH